MNPFLLDFFSNSLLFAKPAIYARETKKKKKEKKLSEKKLSEKKLMKLKIQEFYDILQQRKDEMEFTYNCYYEEDQKNQYRLIRIYCELIKEYEEFLGSFLKKREKKNNV